MDQEILNKLAPEEIEVCNICGSPDIEMRMWVNINTNEVKSSCDDNETFCNKCNAIIRLADLTTMAKFDEANGSIGQLLFPEQITEKKLQEIIQEKKLPDASGEYVFPEEEAEMQKNLKDFETEHRMPDDAVEEDK